MCGEKNMLRNSHMKQILPRDTLNPNSLTCIKTILLYINFSKIRRKSGYVTEKRESKHPTYCTSTETINQLRHNGLPLFFKLQL